MAVDVEPLCRIAGPNGAGKSTSAPELLSRSLRVDEFVNADVIQKETGVSEIAAGRIALHRLDARPRKLLPPLLRGGRFLGIDGQHLASCFDDRLEKCWRVRRVRDNRIWNELNARFMKPRAEEENAAAYADQAWTAEDVEAAVNRGVSAALRRYKERGESVVVWREGKIITLKPEEIEI